MKLVLDEYYSEEKESEIEKDILSFIEKYDEKDYMNHLKYDDNIEKIQALIDNRSNIIQWYDFNENSSLLEIGANYGELTGVLSSKLKKVVSVESSKIKAKAIGKRHFDKDNLTVIAIDDINLIKLDEKFDYILIRDNINKLKYLKKFLKENGTILLLADNKFGISNFAGKNNFKNICEDIPNIYSKNDIKVILENEGFTNYRFFYPLPNYQNTNAIFSDDYLPKYNNTKIMNNRIYNKNDILVFNELEILKQVTKHGLFEFLTNSYMIEINPKTKVKFASFNNSRSKKFRLNTKLYDDVVLKEASCEESKEHIENIKNNIINLKKYGFNIIDKEENGVIFSKFISEKSLYQFVIESIYKEDLTEFYNLISSWFDYIKNKFINEKTKHINTDILDENDKIEDLFIVKCAYVDLVFENTFFINNEYYFFDQEWYLENIPLEFLLYRAINNIFIYNSDVKKVVSKEQVFDHFNILKYIDIFKKIEDYFQDNIIDSKMKLFNSSFKSTIGVDNLCNRIVFYEEENKRKEKYILELQKEFSNKSNEYLKILGELNLYKEEKEKKENYILEIQKELSNKSDEYLKTLGELNLYKEENTKKEKFILELQLENQNKDDSIQELAKIRNELEEKINELSNELNIKNKQISDFENMKIIKLSKKFNKKN